LRINSWPVVFLHSSFPRNPQADVSSGTCFYFLSPATYGCRRKKRLLVFGVYSCCVVIFIQNYAKTIEKGVIFDGIIMYLYCWWYTSVEIPARKLHNNKTPKWSSKISCLVMDTLFSRSTRIWKIIKADRYFPAFRKKLTYRGYKQTILHIQLKKNPEYIGIFLIHQ